MKLKELLLELRYGELSNTAFVPFASYCYSKKDLPKIIMSINATLTHLSTEFLLFNDSCQIVTVPFVDEYHLNRQYALSNLNSPFPKEQRFIIDSPTRPFVDNIIKIQGVHDSSGLSVPMNDPFDSNAIQLVDPTTLYIPTSPNKLFTVSYFANPVEIPLDEPENSDWEVSLPQAFKSVFKLYLLYKIFSCLGTEKGIQMASSYYQQYNLEASVLKRGNFAHNDYMSTLTPINDYGFL